MALNWYSNAGFKKKKRKVWPTVNLPGFNKGPPLPSPNGSSWIFHQVDVGNISWAEIWEPFDLLRQVSVRSGVSMLPKRLVAGRVCSFLDRRRRRRL